MESDSKSKLLNFFGIKDSRKHIVICIRCGSDNIKRKKDLIECIDCGKVISVRSSLRD